MTISLSQLEALAKAATPGPWRISIDSHDGAHDVLSDHAGYRWIAGVDDANGCPDGHFIAACDPATILKLLAVAQAMKAVHGEIDKKTDDDGVDGLSADWMDTINSVMALMEDTLSALEAP